MTPLWVTARIGGPVALPNGPPALDALLAWAIAARDQLPPPVDARDCVRIEVPLARSDCDRFWLASFGEYRVEAHEHRYINRRFPLSEAQSLGNAKVRRINLAGGPCKSYRLPLETAWLVDDRIDWWCLGDREQIHALLALVGYVGKKRGVGLGRVLRWEASPCEAWDGFPVLRDGVPLRPLPMDYPGIVDCDVARRTLDFPYWDHTKEEPCAVMLS